VDEITIGYDDEGTGDDVLVLVHGHPFNRSMWRPQVDRFSKAGYRVIAPDLRGYGESTVVPGITTLTTFATDIAGLLDRLGIGRIVLGGLSMGGQIVMEFHRLFPDRTRALILADTFPRAETQAGKQARTAAADRAIREGMGPYAEEVLWKMVAPHNTAAAPHVLAMMHSTPPEGAAAALRGRAERPDYVAMLTELAVPALVVVGEEDEYTPVSVAQEMHELIPDSALAVIQGAAHMPNLERQTEFDKALEHFLGSLRQETVDLR
jgi:pimeloyl-ACP methyl ester carboxylesterase